ncbi:hypothetical protein LJC49_10735, partial [Ruminococcaceae bacterium OttesenSCG-928-I18]|nr:hypothetical protein [Ruminococcaceae bacterium OttesenSCG-928-I18]
MLKLRKAKPYILSAALTLVSVVAFFLLMLPDHTKGYQNRGWTVAFEQRGDTEMRVEEHTIRAVDAEGYWKIITMRQYLDVYVDGERVFSYTGEENGLPARGIYPIFVRQADVGKVLRLEMTSPYPNDNHMMGLHYSADSYGLSHAGIEFACGVLCLLMGCSLGVVATILGIAKIGKLIVWMLTAAILCFAGFVLSNTRVAMELMGPQAMYWLYMVCYWLYPICMLAYLYIAHTQVLKKALLPFLLLPILFVAGCAVLDIAGVASIDRYSFWYSYICLPCMGVLLVGAAFSRRTTGRVSRVVSAVIVMWVVWVASLLLRYFFLPGKLEFNHEYIVVYTLACGIEFVHNMLTYIRQLLGLRYREMYLTEKNNHLTRYYENIEQHFHEIALLKHEMNHHLVTLGYLHRDGAYDKAGAYLEEIGSAYKAADTMNFCGNHIVNAVFSYLTAEAKKLGAEPQLACHVPDVLPMPDEELSSLLLNLAENALESCSRI